MTDEELIALITAHPGRTERELNALTEHERGDLRAALMRCETSGAVTTTLVGLRLEYGVGDGLLA